MGAAGVPGVESGGSDLAVFGGAGAGWVHPSAGSISPPQDEAQSNEYLNKLKEKDNYEEIKSALIPNEYNMIVTPKEIDELIDNMSSIVARGINMSV